MPQLPTFNYKTESNRYRHYYTRLQVFYQKPIVEVSTALLFTLGTIIFFAIFAIRPTLETIAELLKTIKDQKQVLATAQQKSASLATAQQQYIQAEQDLSVLDAAIPFSYNTQDLTREIEATAGSLGISLENMRITDLKYPLESSNGNTSVKEMAFTVSIEAAYPTAKQFILALQRLPRLINIDSVNLSTPDKNSSKTEINGVQVSMNCRAYYVPKEKEQK